MKRQSCADMAPTAEVLEQIARDARGPTPPTLAAQDGSEEHERAPRGDALPWVCVAGGVATYCDGGVG
jgi:hypothetical protein